MSSFDMMQFARARHAGQKRKYTNDEYFVHLGEVAGIVATVAPYEHFDVMVSWAWGHDLLEDTSVTLEELTNEFGDIVASGIFMLSDINQEGNRAERKLQTRHRLVNATSYVQSVKVADMISNTGTIILHDPKFARVYLPEKRDLLDVLWRAHAGLREYAYTQVRRGLELLNESDS